MSRRHKILWVIPVFQSVYAKPFGNFIGQALGVHAEGDKYDIVAHVPERKLLHGAMNEAIALMLAHDFDAMIVSDDDCFPPFDAIPRLLRHYEDGKEFVAGLGFMRGYPHTTTVGRYYPEGMTLSMDADGKLQTSGFHWLEDIDDEPTDLVEADFCGFPIAMMSRKAIERIEPPYFGTWIDGGSCTHDVYFGVKAKRAGVKILVDRTITCGHLAEAPVLTFQNRGLTRQLAKAMSQAGVA